MEFTLTGDHTVFEITPMGGGMLEFFVVPLVFLLAGVGIVRGWIKFQAKQTSKVIGYVFISFSLFMEVLVIGNGIQVYERLEGALRNAGYQVVEGPVENFEPMNA